MGNKISRFRGNYEFLSNFYPCTISVDNLIFLSSEAAFQAFKCALAGEREQFQYLDAVKAKKKGRQVLLKPDWEFVRLDVMSKIVRLKFEQNPQLREKLLATGSAELIEGNSWHDNFWGDCDCPKCQKITGQNHLGKILMKLRDSI
ncbi:MAG: NADAR family protein [Oscillospiraceae bacterium]|jgi:ribA/ribD-fused uncharacterized protein|nr:NADAR family protein [Oscillospiraceae bacterium]